MAQVSRFAVETDGAGGTMNAAATTSYREQLHYAVPGVARSREKNKQQATALPKETRSTKKSPNTSTVRLSTAVRRACVQRDGEPNLICLFLLLVFLKAQMSVGFTLTLRSHQKRQKRRERNSCLHSFSTDAVGERRDVSDVSDAAKLRDSTLCK